MPKLRFLTPVLITSVLLACSSTDSGGPDGGGGGEGGQSSETGGSGNLNLGGNGNLSVQAQETIGKKGGKVESEGVQLDFPAGALGGGQQITVASLNSTAIEELPQTTSGIVLAAEPVAFLPHGITFDEPVAVALSYDVESVGDVPLVVMKLDNESDTTWEVVPGATFENGQAHFEITSFSVYGIFEDPKGKAEELYSGEEGTGGSTGSGGTDGTGGDEGSGGVDGSGGKGSAGGEGVGGQGTAGGPGAGGDEGSGGVDGSGGKSSGGSGQGGSAGSTGTGGTSSGIGGMANPGGGGAGQGGTAGSTGAGGTSTGSGSSTGAGGVADPGGGGTSQGGTAGGPSGGGTSAGTGASTGAGGATGGPGDGGSSQGGGMGMGGAGPGGGGGVGGVGGGPGGSENPGYLSAGAWHGYGWTFATDSSSIDSDVGYRDAPNCAQGYTGAGFGEVALLGYNINESLDGGDNAETLVTGEGVFVDLDDFWMREHRIQLSAEGGAKNWCAVYSGDGFIPWENFNTTCWDPAGGEAFDPAVDVIESAGVSVPGREEFEEFDFCLRKLQPGLAPVYGHFVHDGFQGDGYVQPSGDTQVFEETLSTRYELPVMAWGDFSATPGSDVTLWFNLNQVEAGGDEGTFLPQQDGVQVDVQTDNGEWMQVVITDGTTTWCAPHYGGYGEFVPWTEFNTNCADGSGSAYAFEPITALGMKFWASPQAIADQFTDFSVGISNFFERSFQNEGYLEQGEFLETQQEVCFDDGMGGQDCHMEFDYGPSWRGYGKLKLAGGATGSSNLTHTNGNDYCSSGTLPAGFDASAELLFALNEERDGTIVPPVTVTNDGARIRMYSQSGTPVNAILVAEDGTRYCYPTVGETDFVFWDEFNTECDGSGVALLSDVLLTHGGLVVPASLESETNYSICFQGFESRKEPVFGYYDGPYHGQGTIDFGGTTQVTSETLTSNESTPYCMEGVLGSSADDFARMRFGANQQPGGSEALAFPQGDGLQINFEGMFEEKMRVVLSTATQDFCADFAGFGYGVAWQDFVACDGSGTPYGHEPFLAISLDVVPGGSSDFSTCFFGLYPYQDGGPGGGMGGAPGGGGGPGGPPVDRTDFHPGYLDDGTWFGSGTTWATDLSFINSDVNQWDGPLACASGMVGEPWSEFASVGYDIDDGAPTSVSGDGVLVDLSVKMPREHRVNLYDASTGTSWCASLPMGAPGTIFVPWTSFNTACWDGTGVPFDTAVDSVVNVSIQVPSSGMEEPFDFCIERLETAFTAQP